MRIGPSTTKQLRITHWDEQGILVIDMDWDDWDELMRDAAYFRIHGRVRPSSVERISPAGNDQDGQALWISPHG